MFHRQPLTQWTSDPECSSSKVVGCATDGMWSLQMETTNLGGQKPGLTLSPLQDVTHNFYMIRYIYFIDWYCCSMDPIPDFQSCTCRKHKFWNEQRLQFSFVRNADVLLIVSQNIRTDEKAKESWPRVLQSNNVETALFDKFHVKYNMKWTNGFLCPVSIFPWCVDMVFNIYIYIYTPYRWCFIFQISRLD